MTATKDDHDGHNHDGHKGVATNRPPSRIAEFFKKFGWLKKNQLIYGLAELAHKL